MAERQVTIRIALVAVGVNVGAAGAVAWASEAEYGSATDLSIRVERDGADVIHTVYVEEQGDRRQVFRGTPGEARAYVEDRRTGSRSFLVPGVIVASGAALAVAALLPFARGERVPSA